MQKNIQRYVTCKDTIDVIGEEIEHNELSSDRGTGKLIASHSVICNMAEQMYGPLYQRRQEADRLRQMLQTLERNSFILNLPFSIKQAKDQRDFEKAMRTYKKAKEIGKDESQAMYTPIMRQVEAVAKDMHRTLLVSLDDVNLPWRDHYTSIRLLRQLPFPMASEPFHHLLMHRKELLLNLVSQELLLPIKQSEGAPSIELEAPTVRSNNVHEQLDSASCIFSRKLLEFHFLVERYVNDLKENPSQTPLPDPFALVNETVQHFISLVTLKLYQSPSKSDLKRRSKRKSSRRSALSGKEELDQELILSDLKDPPRCLMSLNRAEQSLAAAEKLKVFSVPLMDFVEKLRQDMLHQASIKLESGWCSQVKLR